MKIIGIDPGPDKSGWVIWDHSTGNVCDRGTNINAYLLYCMLPSLLQVHTLSFAAIEGLACYGRTVGKAVFQSAYMIGALAHMLSMHSKGVFIIPYAEKSKYFVGSRSSNDAAIRAYLRDHYGEKGTSKKPGPFYGIVNHEWEAAATAIHIAELAIGGNNEWPRITSEYAWLDNKWGINVSKSP